MNNDERPGGERDAWVDPERQKPLNAFDTKRGLSGMGYSQDGERAEGARHPSGEVDVERPLPPGQTGNGSTAADIPPDNGRRAHVDARTGEVHGSGVGAGGGARGEDFDSDSQNGDGYPLTGGEGSAKRGR